MAGSRNEISTRRGANAGVGELQNFIGRTLRLAAGICTRDQRQFIPQLLGRIMRGTSASTADFLKAAPEQLSTPAQQRLSLTRPGAEAARLEGHADLVAALCVLPDGRLVSGSHDNTSAIVEEGCKHRLVQPLRWR
jgi:hypothetical protein